jgi:uncharacterized integral membrane protein
MQKGWLPMVTWLQETGEVYKGQFGEFTVTTQDRRGVIIYRAALTIAAIALALAAILTLNESRDPRFETLITALFAIFCAGLGTSLWTIHIYLKPLHRFLQICWAIGCLSAISIALSSPQALPIAVAEPYALGLVGVGFVFIALTGLLVKEAFCFNRWQAKILALIIPSLLLGHWLNFLPLAAEKILLGSAAAIFLWFSLDKDFQAIPPDVGDKTVFEYLKQPQLHS